MKKFYLLFLFSIICATTSAQLVLNEAHYDPASGSAGDANGDTTRDSVEDEFLEFVNNSGAPLDISGYTIFDENSGGTKTARHVVPALTTIPAGGIYVVFGGGDVTAIDGLANVTAHVSSTGDLSLLNSGDLVIVEDATSANVLTFDPGALGLAMDENQSVERSPSITGDFKFHVVIDGQRFSPGVLDPTITNFIVLNEIGADPDTGVDDLNNDGNPNPNEDEFLEFVNNSGGPLDISGYKLYDLGDYNNNLTSHVFPAGTIIPNGGAIVVFDAGTPTGTFGDAIVQTCDGASANGFTLTNAGATLLIANTSDTVVFVETYDSPTSDDDESLNRDPDITGTTYVLHSSIAAAASAEFSPGTRVNGTAFLDLNVASTGDWNLGGSWESGVPTSSVNAHIPSGVTVTVTSDNEEVDYLRVAGNLVINAGNSLTVSGSLAVEGSVTINSGGSLIVNGISAGNVTYNRNLATTNWYNVSSPVVGQGIVDFYTNETLALGSGTGNAQNVAIAYYDNSQALDTDRYIFYTEGQVDGVDGDDTVDTFNTGVGYTVKLQSSQDISFTGTVRTDNAGVPVTLAQGATNYNLIGNPYLAYINSTTFLGAESANLESTFWIWNGATYDTRTTGTHPNYIISPAQAFFVEAKTTNAVTFTEANQSHETDNFQKSANSRAEIKLNLSNGSENRKTELFYIDGTTTGLDNGFDGKMFGGVTYNFAIYTDLVSNSVGTKYAVQSLPNSDYENMVIPIGVNAAAGKEITFTTETLNLPTGLKVFLEDKLTNSFTRLDEANSNYKVSLTDKSEGTGRFYLHTKASSVLSTEIFDLESVSIYKTSNSNLKVAGLSQGKASIKLFNILGKQVLNTSFSANGNNDISLPKLATGIYIVQLETENGNINKKITLE